MWRVSNVLVHSGLKQTLPIAAHVLARGNRRGSLVHSAAEAYGYGEVIPVLPEHQEFVDGVKAWFRDFQPTVLFTERRLVDRRIRLTGRIDLGVITNERYGFEPYIVDFKRSGEAPWHGIQLVGYADLADRDVDIAKLLDTYNLHRAKWKRSCLYLPGGGKYKWKPFTDPQDAYLFRSALALLQWRVDHGIAVPTDPERPPDDGPLQSGGIDSPF